MYRNSNKKSYRNSNKIGYNNSNMRRIRNRNINSQDRVTGSDTGTVTETVKNRSSSRNRILSSNWNSKNNKKIIDLVLFCGNSKILYHCAKIKFAAFIENYS